MRETLPLSQTIEDRIARYIRISQLNSVYGGEVSKVEKTKTSRAYKSILFCRPRNMDGEVRVYGSTFILVRSTGRENKVCKSETEALDYLQSFVTEDTKKALTEPYRRNYLTHGEKTFPDRSSMWNKPESLK